ncbi:hypothetical protein ACSQ67_015236 [Phaseolus vulgaris]
MPEQSTRNGFNIPLANVGALNGVVLARNIGIVHNSSLVTNEVAEVVGDDERVNCGRGGVESGDGVRIHRSRFDAMLLFLILWLYHLISYLTL